MCSRREGECFVLFVSAANTHHTTFARWENEVSLFFVLFCFFVVVVWMWCRGAVALLQAAAMDALYLYTLGPQVPHLPPSSPWHDNSNWMRTKKCVPCSQIDTGGGGVVDVCVLWLRRPLTSGMYYARDVPRPLLERHAVSNLKTHLSQNADKEVRRCWWQPSLSMHAVVACLLACLLGCLVAWLLGCLVAWLFIWGVTLYACVAVLANAR